MKRVILVGGGTAGHVEPALSVGRWLVNKNSEIELEFIGTKSGVEVELLVDTGIRFHPILKVPFPRTINAQTIYWPFKFIIALIQSVSAIKGANLVIGFGGYVGAPAYLAAKILHVPLMIHEANAKPGLANRLGAKLTKNLFIAFAGLRNLGGNWANAKLVGMPIKDSIDNFSKVDTNTLRSNFLSNLGLEPSKKTLLIFGGSIGAQQINIAVSGAVSEIQNLGWNVIHSLGARNEIPISTSSYKALPYIFDMTSAYAAADFVISRSGAVTCAELSATGVPALLIPLPIGNGEQEANAMELLSSGQALKVANADFTSDWLKSNLKSVLESAPKRISGTSRAAAAQMGEIALRLI